MADISADEAQLLAEYRAALKEQGLPSSCTVARFVEHHRSNAALAATFNAYGAVHEAEEQSAALRRWAENNIPEEKRSGMLAILDRAPEHRLDAPQQFRVHEVNGYPHNSRSVTYEEAARLLPLYDDAYGEDGRDFEIQERHLTDWAAYIRA